MRRWIFALVALVACGGAADVAAPVAELTVVVDQGDGEPDSATLTCTSSTAGSGTGWLSDEGPAADACEVVSSNAARLTAGAPADAFCTQQYGGPQTARVTGTVDERSVSAEFHRADGCGIADWTLFEPLLGRPLGGPEPIE